MIKTVVLTPKMWHSVFLISFPYCASKWTDVFELEYSVKFLRSASSLLVTSRFAPAVIHSLYPLVLSVR
jgi:hypothetical protein